SGALATTPAGLVRAPKPLRARNRLMTKIVPIVEGHGEVAAVPILIRRIAEVVSPGRSLEVLPPIRVSRQRLLKEGELERAAELAGRKAQPDGGILVLLDAERD